MSNLKVYKKVFIEQFNLKNTEKLESLEYNQINEWDSIGHMGLIGELEDKFKITFDTDDIVEFSSFKKGLEILKKYKIKFN